MHLAVAHLDEQVQAIYTDYNFKRFSKLVETLGLNQSQLGKYLDISSSTLDRRRQGKFSFQESNRMYELELFFEKTREVIGDKEDTQLWLKRNNQALGDIPLELVKTVPGREAIFLYLEQVARGVVL